MKKKIILTMAIGAVIMSGCAKKYEKIDTTTATETIAESTVAEAAETEDETETESDVETLESVSETVPSTTVASSTKAAETVKETSGEKTETADTKSQQVKNTTEAVNLLGKGDTTDDPERDAKEEIDTYFIGNHVKSYDGSELTIEKTGDYKFNVDLGIVRLCSLEGGKGTYDSHKINVEFEDPSGNSLSAVIYRDGDNNLAVRITDSTWDYLPNGEIIDGFGK